MFELIRRDMKRYFDAYGGQRLSVVDKLRISALEIPQFQAVVVFRFGHWLKSVLPRTAIRYPFMAFYHLLSKTTQVLWGPYIHVDAEIGGGLYIVHPGDLAIGPVKMGEDCTIFPNVLIGLRNGGSVVPTIGDRVWIGSSSVLYGSIVIGSGTTVCPVTAVGRNVAPRSLVAGNPMQVIRRDYDNTDDIYGTPRSKQRASVAQDVKADGGVSKS